MPPAAADAPAPAIHVRHSRTGAEVVFSKAEMRAREPSPAMEQHSQRVAEVHAKKPLAELVLAIDPTATATAAPAVAGLLDQPSFSAEGVSWTRNGALGNELTVGNVTMKAYDTYKY